MANIEHQMQHALTEWWKLSHREYKLPEFALFAIPNGGARNAVTGAILKREGVRKGIPDLMLVKRNKDYSGLFIELKAPKGIPTKEQKEFIEFANNEYLAVICYDWQAAAKIIHNYITGDQLCHQRKPS
jgi:hypothetical protein